MKHKKTRVWNPRLCFVNRERFKMKNLVLAAALIGAGCSAFAADVGVSININQPGLYGRIDLGNVAPPQVIYTRPVIIQPAIVGVAPPPPLYLHVPPGHEKHWDKHCREYNACGQPVYFVKEDWYAREYAPHHRYDHHEERYEERRDERYDEHRREHHDEREYDRDHDRHHDHDDH